MSSIRHSLYYKMDHSLCLAYQCPKDRNGEHIMKDTGVTKITKLCHILLMFAAMAISFHVLH